MKKILVLLALTTSTFFACEIKVNDPDKLAEVGILGTWEIHGQTINGITNMAVQCCEFVEFSPAGEPTDYSGDYKAYGGDYEVNGRFTVVVRTKTLTTFSEGRQEEFSYLIEDDFLEISYTDGSDLIDLTYIRRE